MIVKETVDDKLRELEQAIVVAEDAKRQFVKENPSKNGDKGERMRLYNEVEKARKALREYKRLNCLF